jgi:hypothetical protein
LGIGDWGLGPIPNPQSPIPNPQSPIPNPQYLIHFIGIYLLNYSINIIKITKYILKNGKKRRCYRVKPKK